MATTAEAQQALVDAIEKAAKANTSGKVLLELAEAYAWVVTPNNSHGGGSRDKG